jgi:DNA-binding NarL/FixJ family response regulator
MKAETERSFDSSVPEAELLAVVACACDGESQARIQRALSEQELPIREFVADPAVVPTLDVDTSTIVILVCGADKPREMAALRRLRRDAPDPAIVVISPPATGTGVRRVLDAGADALVFEPELERTLATTVRAVSIGQSAVPRKFLASVEKPVLSHRENEVLALVRGGLTNAEIAERLFLAESTVKSHLSSIFTKFGVRSRKEVAAAFAEGDHAVGGAVALAGNGEPPERATA